MHLLQANFELQTPAAALFASPAAAPTDQLVRAGPEVEGLWLTLWLSPVYQGAKIDPERLVSPDDAAISIDSGRKPRTTGLPISSRASAACSVGK